jgi:hypothetical protein
LYGQSFLFAGRAEYNVLVFELLDRQYDLEVLRPRNAIAGVVSLLMIVFGAGVLIGMRNWGSLAWLSVGFCCLLVRIFFAPFFRGFYGFLKDARDHRSENPRA